MCMCAYEKKSCCILLLPLDVHSNALLPLTDDAGNGYCQYEGELIVIHCQQLPKLEQGVQGSSPLSLLQSYLILHIVLSI